MDANQTSYNFDISIKKGDITSTDITENVKQQLCPTQIKKELCEEEKPDNAARNIESQMSYQFPRIKMEPLEDGNNTGDEINDVSQQSGILSTIKTEQTSISYSSDGTYFHPDVNLSTVKKELIDVPSDKDNNFEMITSEDTPASLKGNSQGFKCEGIESELPAIRPCTCPNCDNFFCEKRNLNCNFLVPNSEKYFCNKCSKQFRKEESLNQHLMYGFCLSCKVCQAGFTLKKDLQQHKKDLNHFKKSKPDRYKCHKCEKWWLTIKGLEAHYCPVFKCDECKESFNRERHLNRHKVKHLTDQYKCIKCQKCFLTSRGLKKHSRVCFNRSVKNLLKCAECKAGFAKMNDFIIHMNENRIENSLECSSCKIKVLYKCHFKRH